MPEIQDGPTTLEYAKERVDLLVVVIDKLEHNVDRRFADIDSVRLTAVKGIDERFKHLEQLFNVNSEATKRAVDKAESAQAAHNVASNEWRGTLNDFKATLVGREEFQRLDRDFSAYRLEVSRIIAAQAGEKSGTKETKDESKFWTQNAIAIIAALIALAALVLEKTSTSVPVQAQTAPSPQVLYVPSPPGTLLPTTPPQPAPR